MSRDELINITRTILVEGGYDISPLMPLRSACFDVIGRKEDTLLIIKILSNIDAFSRENAEEIKILAEMLCACPLLIGERSSSGILEPGIVYSRFNIRIVSNETLSDCILDNTQPFIFTAPGGLYVKLNNDLLRNIRKTKGISLGTLAEVAGVSRHTIQMYETGMGAMIDAALRLEEYLDIEIIKTVNPFEYKFENKTEKHELSKDKRSNSVILNHLLDMGFNITPIIRGPFEAITRNEDIVILTGLNIEDEKLIQKVAITSSISRIVRKHSLIIVENKHNIDEIELTAIITKDELKKMDDKNELTDIILSRGKR